MKTSAFALGLFIIIPFLLGCSYPMEELGLYRDGSPRLPWVGAQDLGEMPVNFKTVKSISLATCLECHTQGSRSMDTPEKVLTLQNEILRTIETGTMPPKASGLKTLNACEKQILETWLQGQNNNTSQAEPKIKDIPACQDLSPAPQKPRYRLKDLEVTFENLQKEVFAVKCLSCHTEETAKKTRLDSIEAIISQELIGTSPENSILYQIVVPGLNKRFMPPVRSGIPALSEEEVEFLKNWIELIIKTEPSE